MLNLKDLYWLAGLLEGEGWFGIAHDGSNLVFRLQVASTDEDVIRRASLILLNEPRYSISDGDKWYRNKTVYNAGASGKLAISWMMTLYSLMATRRKAKMREVIETWRSYNLPSDKCPKGHTYTIGKYKSGMRKGEVIRRCNTCAWIAKQARKK